MPGAAPAREQMCAGGEIPPPAPWALFLAAGRLPPQPPTTPLRHHVPRDTAVVPRCLVPHTSTMHAPTSGAEHAAGTERPFPFHLHISIAEEGNDLGADHRAPEPSTYSTNLNPSPTWRLSCTQQGLFWRERCRRESIFHCSLDRMLWGKDRKPQSVSHASFPPFQACRCHETHPQHRVFNAAPAMLNCLEMSPMQVLSLDNI